MFLEHIDINMDKNNFIQLIEAYLSGGASDAEKALLEAYCTKLEERKYADLSQKTEDAVGEIIYDNIRSAIGSKAQIPPTSGAEDTIHIPAKSTNLWKQMLSIAAAITLIMVTASLLYFKFDWKESKQQVFVKNTLILPGSKKAILQLANGQVFNLDAQKDGLTIDSKGLTYFDGDTISTANIDVSVPQLLMASTPRGGNYDLTLPDGTKVYLNAATILRFPSVFGTGKRIVELVGGEAYFEVKKDDLHPFIVKSRGQMIEVLGTHFNVNSYDEEPFVKTTLQEGSVRITADNLSKVVLKPGQMAVRDSKGIKVQKSHLDVELAWRNGMFISQGGDFKSMMQTIGRWYDVDVIFDYEPQELSLVMKVSRSRDIHEVLKRLESTGDMKFKIEGRRVHVVK
jgi:Fe2+-dicitrate sensor, membrane component